VQSSSNDKISLFSIPDITSKFPNLLSFSTTASSGTYSSGDQIIIRANFGRPVLSGSTMTVQMNSGGVVNLNSINGNTLSGTYTVGAGEFTPDLKVDSITSANIVGLGNTRISYELPSSVGDFEAENSFITRNLGDSKNIVIGSYKSIDVGDNPYQISGNIGGYTYVANQGTGDVSVIRISDDVVVDTIDVGVKPYYVTTLGTNVYVTNGASNTVSVIDTNTNSNPKPAIASNIIGVYPTNNSNISNTICCNQDVQYNQTVSQIIGSNTSLSNSSYQWQMRNTTYTNNSEWINIPNATSKDYLPTGPSNHSSIPTKHEFRRIVISNDLVYYPSNIILKTFFNRSRGRIANNISDEKNFINTSDNEEILIYPNPATSSLYISNLKDYKNVTLYINDLTGRALYAETKTSFDSNDFPIDISNLPKGVYFLIIETNTKKTNIKFIKE
jgi:YVTN family beta-propeller protein